GIAEVRIPIISRTDEQDSVPRITDNIAVISNGQFDFISGGKSAWEQYAKKTICIHCPLVGTCCLIGKSGQRLAAKRYGFDREKTRKLERNKAFAGAIDMHANRGYSADGIVGVKIGFDLIVGSAKSGVWRDSFRKTVRAPDVVEIGALGFSALAK